jgi:uncharacterized lipoprotein
MGIDPKAKVVAAAVAAAALSACGAAPTEPQAPALDDLARTVAARQAASPGVTIPQEPFGSFFHS